MVRPREPKEQTEERLDTIAGLTLLVGSTLSVLIMATGFALLARGTLPSQAVAQPPEYVIVRAIHLDPLALLNLGILVLMATPLLRVIVAILGFAFARMWQFVGVSSFVLVMLLISLLVASR